ncbi:MAG: glycosyltransferase [Desulfobacula sp.]|jgi:glycosyltransferase involved in cell wall biosynthesis|nr:glycosyltransferase [Desulfobacula sp.]
MNHKINNEVLLGIALPIFNGEKYLEETIDSLLSQTLTDFRLVLSDNASTDRTSDICLFYAEKDNRIKYVRNNKNIGIVRNSEQAFTLCRPCKYITLIGHDDIWEPTYSKNLTELLEKNSQAVMAISKYMHIDSEGNEFDNKNWIKNYEIFEKLKSPDRKMRLSAGVTYMLEHAVLREKKYKTDFCTKHYGIYEDVFLGFAMFAQGPCLLYNEILFKKRLHGINFSSNLEYKKMNSKINCLSATIELNKRFNLNPLEFLICWSTLVHFFRFEKPKHKYKHKFKKLFRIIIK